MPRLSKRNPEPATSRALCSISRSRQLAPRLRRQRTPRWGRIKHRNNNNTGGRLAISLTVTRPALPGLRLAATQLDGCDAPSEMGLKFIDHSDGASAFVTLPGGG